MRVDPDPYTSKSPLAKALETPYNVLNNEQSINFMSTKKTGKEKKTTYKNSGYYFDDCGICRAMAKADEEGRSMSLEETREVFRKAGGTIIKGK